MGESNPPAMKLITDFVGRLSSCRGKLQLRIDGRSARRHVALSGRQRGDVFHREPGGLTFKGTVPAPTAANMYPNSGFVVYMNGPACINASSYTGVSFTISGSGTCGVVFAFGDKEHTSGTDDAARGTCTGTCYAGQFDLTVSASPATVKMPFSGTATTPRCAGGGGRPDEPNRSSVPIGTAVHRDERMYGDAHDNRTSAFTNGSIRVQCAAITSRRRGTAARPVCT